MKAFSVCLVFAVIAATFAQDEHVLSSDVKVKAIPKRVQGANDPPVSMDLRANFTAVKDEKKCRKLRAVRQSKSVSQTFSFQWLLMHLPQQL